MHNSIKGLLYILMLMNQLNAQDANNTNLERIILISIPKCGTSLITKIIMSLSDKNPSFSQNNLYEINNSSLDTQTFILSHAKYTSDNINFIKNNDFKGIFLYRDPRDQIVSTAHWIKSQNQWPTLKNLSIHQLITLLIRDCCNILRRRLSNINYSSINIDAFYRKHYMGWLQESTIYQTTFEKLVGQKGGGCDEIQKQEIKNIALYLNIEVDNEKIENIAASLFGTTGTFREGKIGLWKKYFNKRQKDEFKENAGLLLIELGYEKDLNWR